MQGHGRIIAHDFCVAHREANSGLSTLNRTKSILSIYHQQRQLQKQRGMCLNDTYPFCQQPLSGNCHSICFSKPVLWTATPSGAFVLDKFQRLSLTAPITAKCRCGRACRPPRRISIHLRRARRKIERACRPPRRIPIYFTPCTAQSLRRFYAVLLPEVAKHAIHYQICLSFRAL